MSIKTVHVCDLCKEETSDPANVVTIKFAFGNGCDFDGEVCEECLEKLRHGIRGASRYDYKWPTFRQPSEEAPVQPPQITAVEEDAPL